VVEEQRADGVFDPTSVHRRRCFLLETCRTPPSPQRSRRLWRPSWFGRDLAAGPALPRGDANAGERGIVVHETVDGSLAERHPPH